MSSVNHTVCVNSTDKAKKRKPKVENQFREASLGRRMLTQVRYESTLLKDKCNNQALSLHDIQSASIITCERVIAIVDRLLSTWSITTQTPNAAYTNGREITRLKRKLVDEYDEIDKLLIHPSSPM